MSKQIIILDRINLPSDNSFRVAFWLSVPAPRQSFYANAAATSQYVNAITAEVTAIQLGQVVEYVQTCIYPTGTTIASIQADLIAKFNTLQANITNLNPYSRYGSFWDGTAWTAQGVA